MPLILAVKHFTSKNKYSLVRLFCFKYHLESASKRLQKATYPHIFIYATLAA